MDPITLAALISGGGAILGGGLGAWGANKAGQQQAGMEQAYLNYLQTASAPFREVGTNATGAINSLYGWGAGGSGNPNWQQFVNSPDYSWAQGQGQSALNNQLSAMGTRVSGGGLAAVSNYNQGLASQQFGNYFDRLYKLAGMGASTVSSTAGAMGNAFGGVGAAHAGGTVGATNALGGALTGVGNAANQYGQNNMLMSMWNNRNMGSGVNNGQPMSISPGGYSGSATPGWSDYSFG